MAKYNNSSRFRNRKFLLITFIASFALIGSYFAFRSFALTPPPAGKAVLYLTPSSKAVKGTFDVSVKVHGAGTPLNAVQVDLWYPSDKLDYVQTINVYSHFPVVGKQDAVTYFGSQSKLSIVRATFKPCSLDCQITVVRFKVKPGASGEADLNFGIKSLAVAANNSSNVLESTQSAILTVTP